MDFPINDFFIYLFFCVAKWKFLGVSLKNFAILKGFILHC